MALKDVYVTDHKAEAKKYLTNGEEEDQDFYDYEQSLKDYYAAGSASSGAAGSGKYARGSLMQRIVDPFAGSTRDAEGSIVIEVTDQELAAEQLDSEERMRQRYERVASSAEAWDVDPEDEDAWRAALVDDLDGQNKHFKLEDFHAVLDKELGVFAQGEKYNFSKDLKDAYKNSLATSLEHQMFKTIPDHVFWDIKKPLIDSGFVRQNRYNPFRGREYSNFFEMRDAEEYLDMGKQHRNLNRSVSRHQQY